MRYKCDRCKVAELREDEYENNRNARGIYCEECWNYIHLQKYKTPEGHLVTIRSERKITA